MARKMKRTWPDSATTVVTVTTVTVVTVYAHGITKNFWEYYILDNEKASDYRFALVEGYEQEMGDVSMSEIKPYLISVTANLNDIAPAQGWEWVD